MLLPPDLFIYLDSYSVCGVATGMLDGLLGLLYFAYETGASLLESARSFWNSAWAYVDKLRQQYARTESWLKLAETVTNDTRAVVKHTLLSLAQTYQTIKGLVTAAATNWQDILTQLAVGIQQWVGEIVSDAALAGYFVGQLAFEILSDVATGGGTAAAGFFAKASKWLGKLNDRTFDLAGTITKSMREAARRPAVAARVARCKLLGAGCFVAGTTVMSAAGPTAIQDVQPLDYVVASSAVVAYDAEVGYRPPFTSPSSLSATGP